MNKIRQIPEPFSLQDAPSNCRFLPWGFCSSSLLRALDVNDRFSLSDKNVYDYKLLFFVRIHIAVNQTRRNVEEISTSDFDSTATFLTIFQPHAPGFEKPIEMPCAVMVPIRYGPASNPCP